MKPVSVLLFLLFLGIHPNNTDAQTLCTPMGSSMYCSGYEREPTVITPFSRNQGLITRGTEVVPYTSLPSPKTAPAPIEPLRSLEPLPMLEPLSPRSSGMPMDESLLPFGGDGMLLLGE